MYVIIGRLSLVSDPPALHVHIVLFFFLNLSYLHVPITLVVSSLNHCTAMRVINPTMALRSLRKIDLVFLYVANRILLAPRIIEICVVTSQCSRPSVYKGLQQT